MLPTIRHWDKVPGRLSLGTCPAKLRPSLDRTECNAWHLDLWKSLKSMESWRTQRNGKKPTWADHAYLLAVPPSKVLRRGNGYAV